MQVGRRLNSQIKRNLSQSFYNTSSNAGCNVQITSFFQYEGVPAAEKAPRGEEKYAKMPGWWICLGGKNAVEEEMAVTTGWGRRKIYKNPHRER